MLKSAHFKNFTCFADAELPFARGLNIFLGDNGTGKSHALKAIYSLLQAEAKRSKVNFDANYIFESDACDYLERNFRAKSIRSLARQSENRDRSEIALSFKKSDYDFSVDFSSKAHGKVHLTKQPLAWEKQTPLFFPDGELLSLFPDSKICSYENYVREYEDETFEFRKLLNAPQKTLPESDSQRAHLTRTLASYLKAILHGEVVCDDGYDFSLRSKSTDVIDELPKSLEMAMLSDGMRKFAVLDQLVLNGNFARANYFFWDTPERDLNPSNIRVLAQMLLVMANRGMQVFIATHSAFLVREINMLLKYDMFKARVKYLSFIHTYSDTARMAKDGVKKYKDRDPSLPPVEIYTGIKILDGNSYGEIFYFTAKDEEVQQARAYYKDEYESYDGHDEDEQDE